MEKRTLAELQDTLGYQFRDPHLLLRALTHRSFSNEHQQVPHNERLEFLGDAVLQFVSTVRLFSLFPDAPEGVLSAYRSLLVKTEFLLTVAERFQLRKHMRVSEGQKRDMRHAATPVLADGVEALIGAIYLDGTLSAAEDFILNKVLVDIEGHLSATPYRDPKTMLQEYTQQEQHTTPEYVVLEEYGADHEREFRVSVRIEGKEMAEAIGKSKRRAEQDAAEKVLTLLRGQGKEIR